MELEGLEGGPRFGQGACSVVYETEEGKMEELLCVFGGVSIETEFNDLVCIKASSVL